MEKMKALRKKLAAKGGFTLVELIVVIAILAILAAVAVPTYTGYIAKAREAADLQTLSSVATAITGSAAGDGAVVDKIVVTKSMSPAPTAYEGSTEYSYNESEVRQLLGIDAWSDLTFSANTKWTTATMNDGKWTLDTSSVKSEEGNTTGTDSGTGTGTNG